MTYMFEVYYQPPSDPAREAELTEEVARFQGRLDFREENGTVCLTYEFDDRVRAEAAAQSLRKRGEHVEGPGEYGP